MIITPANHVKANRIELDVSALSRGIFIIPIINENKFYRGNLFWNKVEK